MCILTAFQGIISIKLNDMLESVHTDLAPSVMNTHQLSILFYMQKTKIDFMLLYILGDCHAS